MTIAETREKCKSLVARIPKDAVVLAVLVSASSASFGLGFLAGRDTGQGSEIVIQDSPLAALSQLEQAPTSAVGAPVGGVGVVASKNGTKYYLPECSGANRISEANKVWFASPEAASAAGYTPAVNCKGI